MPTHRQSFIHTEGTSEIQLRVDDVQSRMFKWVVEAEPTSEMELR